MVESGLFITLYDKETLNLYLNKGIYGFHQKPLEGRPSSRSRHYHALADYSCAREGTHVFFFLKRMIGYGGQIIGNNKYGSFYLNGPYSPMGKKADAEIYWDESTRKIYDSVDEPGKFIVPKIDKKTIKCQPYLVRFKDNLNLKGKWISSDQLYFKLGEYPYPLPSNSIQNMGFCILSPGETKIALSLLKKDPMGVFSGKSNEQVSLSNNPIPFDPKFDIDNLSKAIINSYFINEAHMESSILANPTLLPDELQPGKNDALIRQIPISPFKPSHMDRADICYFSEDKIANGTIPNTIIELKNKKAGKQQVEQVKKYFKWLYKLNEVYNVKTDEIKIYLLAPDFTDKVSKYIPDELSEKIVLMKFNDKQKKFDEYC